MPWLRHLAVLFAFLAAFARPAPASALSPASPESRVGGFEVAAQLLAGELGAASLEQHQGIGAAYDENVSGYRFAAGGGPPIKAGTSGGPTAGQRFSQGVREEAFAENPTKTCVFCRREGTGTQVDHASARARGGDATIDNAQLACPHCNASKGAGQFPKTPPAGYEGPWPPPHWKRE